MTRAICAAAVAAGLMWASVIRADDAADKAVPSRHRLMKECMAKEKASDGGMPKQDMKKNCRDVTATERENEKTEKAAEKHAEAPAK